MHASKRIFYGWIIVGASLVILAVGLGMFISTNSVFVKPICDSLGFARSQFTLHRTVLTLTGAFILPLFAKVIRRLGVRKTLLIGSSALSLITVGYSFANSLWHFYVLAFFNGLFVNAVNFMVVGILIGAWFEDKRGFATGIAYSGSGLGGAIMIPIVSNLIGLVDWRFGYRFMGILGAAILIPVIIIFIKDSPAKLGLLPYTKTETEDDMKKSAENPPVNLSLQDSFRTSRFWFLIIAFFFISFFAGATNTHSAPYLSDLGYSTAMVSAVISLFMIFLTAGKILLGIIYDRFDTMFGNIFVAVCSLIFPIAALLLPMPAVPWIYAVTVGIASCGLSVPVPILITRYFGAKDYPAIFSLITMISTFGPALSVPAMGAVYDFTGSYKPAWVALLILSGIIAVSLVGAELSYKRRRTT